MPCTSIASSWAVSRLQRDLRKLRRVISVQVDKDEKSQNKLIMQTVNVHEVRCVGGCAGCKLDMFAGHGILLFARQVLVNFPETGIDAAPVQESYTPIDHISNWKENQRSAYFSKTGKHIIHHPGEVRPFPLATNEPDRFCSTFHCRISRIIVHLRAKACMQCNKIRVIPQYDNMVVTHSDCPDLYVWDFEKQENKHQKPVRLTPHCC